MDDKSKPTEGSTETAPVEKTTIETPVEQPKEKTAAEILKESAPAPKEAETVGLDKYLTEKKERKAAEKALKDLQEKYEKGEDKENLSDDLDDLANEFPDLNRNFLKKFGDIVERKAGKIAEERLKPIEEKEKNASIDSAFKKHYKIAIESMPEFKDIVNPEVIKTLSLDPRNANKTFAEIIEDTYGHTVTGKRSIEITKPGGGKEPAPLDSKRALKDPEYFKEVMDNPKLKDEYNKAMLARGV